jgi:hypothetical protein
MIDELVAPAISVQGKFGELTEEGIDFLGAIIIDNPNDFDLTISDIVVNIETETQEEVGSLLVEGGLAEAQELVELPFEGIILLKAVDAETLFILVEGDAGIHIAGIAKTLPLAVEAELQLPQLEEIIAFNAPTDLSIKADTRATLRGIVSDLTLEMKNPNNISLIARDITFILLRVDNDQEQLIGKTMIDDAYVEKGNTTIVTGEILMPYSKLFSLRYGLLPDYLKLTVRANVTIPGINQILWIGVSGYQDLHMFS